MEMTDLGPTEDKDDLKQLKQEYLQLCSEMIELNIASDGKIVQFLTGKSTKKPTHNVLNTPTKQKEFVVDPTEVKRITTRMQEIQNLHHDLFYRMYSPTKSLWQQLMEKNKSHLRDFQVEGAILWICSQQTIEKYLQPRFLQLWLQYFFDYCQLPDFDSLPSLELLLKCLNDTRDLCTRKLVNTSELSMITISQYLSLCTLAHSTKNPMFIEIFTVIKELLFNSRQPVIITNKPTKIFHVLFAELNDLDQIIQTEVILLIDVGFNVFVIE